MTTDTDTAPTITEPTEPGWYAYDGGRQVMIFHLRETHEGGRQWSVHLDNGTAGDCVWGYIEQALGVWRLVRIEPPAAEVLDPPETLRRLVAQWGAESIRDAFDARWPEAGVEPSYEVRLREAIEDTHRWSAFVSTRDGHRECYCGHVLVEGERYVDHVLAVLRG